MDWISKNIMGGIFYLTSVERCIIFLGMGENDVPIMGAYVPDLGTIRGGYDM